MEFKPSKEWVASMMSRPTPTAEEVEAVLSSLQDGRESYVLASLLSFDNDGAERIIGAFARLRGFDREDLGEVMEEIVSRRSATIMETIKAKGAKVVSPIWGIS